MHTAACCGVTGKTSPSCDMENLVYSVNVTLPVFAILAIGYLLRQAKVIDGAYVSGSNRLTFRLLLPVMLFNNLRSSDFLSYFDVGFLCYCAAFLMIYVAGLWLISSRFIPNRKKLGSFIQGAFRGNTAVIGLAVAQSIYGDQQGPMPLMLGVAMVSYNVLSTVILTCCGESGGEKTVLRVCREILRNPIIWGIALGLVCALTQVRFPPVLEKTFSSLGGAAVVVSLIAAGGGFEIASFRTDIGLIAAAVGTKLIIMPLLALTGGYLLGYRGITLFSILAMAGVSTATTSTVMAQELKCDEPLAIHILTATTLCVSVTLTLWITILSAMGVL